MTNTRKNIVTIILTALLATLGAVVGLREHGELAANSKPTAKAQGKTRAEEAGPVKHAQDGSRVSGAGDIAAKVSDAGNVEEPAEPPLVLDRPVRVVSLGWDLAVPGHLANMAETGQDSAFATSGLTMELRSVAKLSALKEALANGGAHTKGADIAILPLPEMVASYEDLRALKPQIFFIVGWSRGRDALVTHGKASLAKLPGKGEIALVGERGQAATLLALFLLDSSNVGLERIRLRGASDSKLMFSAVDRSTSAKLKTDDRIALTSADASALIPYVAIAPEGFLANQRATRAWIAAWLQGVDQLERDVPAAARRVGALPGAPQTVDLVRRLGMVEFSDLHENVRRAGLAGRDPVTLARLFTLTWRLWREIDVLTTPAPTQVPVSFDAITSLILESPEPQQSLPIEADFGTEPLLRSVTPVDLADTALLAGIFGRSSLRIGAQKSRKRTAEAIEELAVRYGLSNTRFESAPALSSKTNVTIEILAAR